MYLYNKIKTKNINKNKNQKNSVIDYITIYLGIY
jgi:hypothetical protein